MEIYHNGLELAVTKNTDIAPGRHYETYNFKVPKGKAGSITIRVTENKDSKFIWVWDIGINKEIVGLKRGYGSLFLHHALKELEDFPGIENYKVKPNGTTPCGKKFFESYDALPNINYSHLVKRLEEKINKQGTS